MVRPQAPRARLATARGLFAGAGHGARKTPEHTADALTQESQQRVRELHTHVGDRGCSGRGADRDSPREGFRCARREQQAL
jgi:hypothetical protein